MQIQRQWQAEYAVAAANSASHRAHLPLRQTQARQNSRRCAHAHSLPFPPSRTRMVGAMGKLLSRLCCLRQPHCRRQHPTRVYHCTCSATSATWQLR
jgi:hypothetical protein